MERGASESAAWKEGAIEESGTGQINGHGSWDDQKMMKPSLVVGEYHGHAEG